MKPYVTFRKKGVQVRCSSCEPLLDAYLEGTLSARQLRTVGTHVGACSACRGLLAELRVVDALLTTAKAPNVGANFTATVVSAARDTQPRTRQRLPIGLALLLYLGIAWAATAVMIFRTPNLSYLRAAGTATAARDLAAFGAALRALAPATPVAAATVTAILLLDLLLFIALFYGYRAVHPRIALYLARGPRP